MLKLQKLKKKVSLIWIKKTSTDVPIDNEKDAFLFKKTVTTTEEKKEKKEEKETDPSKGQAPVTKKNYSYYRSSH